MRLIGLDIGNKRTGIALYDERGISAKPLEVVETDKLSDRLRALVTEQGASAVVVGRPRHLDGSLGAQAEIIDRTVELLKGSIPVNFLYEDETGTTQAANGTDADAACVILQGYLDEQARQ